MPFFRKRPPTSPGNGAPGSGDGTPPPLFRQYAAEDAQQVAADQDALERGTIPDGAKARIQRTVAGTLPWMSTLNIHDVYLADTMRIEPLAQVAGSCYYHAATDSSQRIFLDSNMDASNLVRAYYQAKEIAMDRLIEEAHLAGAHAVIDARHTFHREETLVHFSIVGTAVQFPGLKAPKTPLVSPLSGSDLFKLWSGGWMPVGFALGYHWHCMPVGYRTQLMTGSWSNTEVTTVTDKLMKTRSNAVQRMQQDGKSLHRINGFVGVEVRSWIEETEILFSRGSSWDRGVTIDGSFFPYEETGTVKVPAFNTEFFATGASVAKISSKPLGRADIAPYLEAWR